MKGKRKYIVNVDFFDSWSLPMAYILGFITADGSVSRYSLTIQLQERDREVLEYIRGQISPCSPIKVTKKKQKRYLRLRINSVRLLQSLVRFGIVPNKTPTIKVNFEIPNEFFGTYLRGLFDGDGWVYNRRNIIESGICSGSAGFLDYFCERTQLGSIRKRKKGKSACWNWELSYTDSVKLSEIMYAVDGFCLSRKKERFYIARQPRSPKFWTPDEIEYLDKNHRPGVRGNLFLLAQKLCRSRKAVAKKVWELGLVSRNSCGKHIGGEALDHCIWNFLIGMSARPGLLPVLEDI